MVDKLAAAERDLKHAERMREYDPPPEKLAAAFADPAHRGPTVVPCCARELSALDRVDPLDAGRSRPQQAELKDGRQRNVDYQRCQHELWTSSRSSSSTRSESELSRATGG